MIRCSALTKAGKQCSITSLSNWVDNNGRCVAEPLCRGGDYCLLHAKPFCTSPALLEEFDNMVVFILDLETTGVDITKDRIVEIAATHAHCDARMYSESFATTVHVDQNILTTRGLDAFKVHGITDEEIAAGPTFEQVWIRFVKWIEDVTNNATVFEESYSDDEALKPMILQEPVVVLAAHNGSKFDFPLLLCEVLRNNLSTNVFEQWHFIDTLDVSKSLDRCGCVKLQCLCKELAIDSGNAHRALDDCLALRNILHISAQRCGLSFRLFLSLYVVEVDLDSSIAQLSVLL